MLRRFTEDDGYCVFFIIRLSRRDRLLYYSRLVWTKSKKRDGFIKQEGSKKQRSPLLSPKKKALFVCVCRFLSKNEKKCRQKSVEEFVNETRTKKNTRIKSATATTTRERKKEGLLLARGLRVFFFFSFAFFSERAR